jgi:hypothetical protein
MKPKQYNPIALSVFDALQTSQSVGNEGSMRLRGIETSGLAIGRLKSLSESGFVGLVLRGYGPGGFAPCCFALCRPRRYGPGGFALCPSSLRAKSYGPSSSALRGFALCHLAALLPCRLWAMRLRCFVALLLAALLLGVRCFGR